MKFYKTSIVIIFSDKGMSKGLLTKNDTYKNNYKDNYISVNTNALNAWAIHQILEHSSAGKIIVTVVSRYRYSCGMDSAIILLLRTIFLML